MPGSLGIAMGIVVVVGLSLVAFAAISPVPGAQEQTAAVTAAVDPFADTTIEASAAIVIDTTDGKILYAKNSEVQLPLASLTKVALVLAVAETLHVDSVITIPYYAGGSVSTSHLSKGEEWRVADVIDFTLVESSNNGAEILADVADPRIHERFPDSPSEKTTLWRMNELARRLGLTQTYFLNVSGLDLSETQAGAYGSAHDIAILFAYAASAEPRLFASTAKNGVLLTAPDGVQMSASNTNSAQGAIPGLMMGKTGFTDLAGGNLAVVFDVGLSHPVVAVVLGSSEKGRFTDMKKLVETTRAVLEEEQ